MEEAENSVLSISIEPHVLLLETWLRKKRMTNKDNLDGVRHFSSKFHRFLKAENWKYLFVYGYTLFICKLDFGKYFYALDGRFVL